MDLNRIFFPAPKHTTQQLFENQEGVIFIPKLTKGEPSPKTKREKIHQFSIQVGSMQQQKTLKKNYLCKEEFRGDSGFVDFGDQSERNLSPQILQISQSEESNIMSNIIDENCRSKTERRVEFKQDMASYLSPSFSQINSFVTKNIKYPQDSLMLIRNQQNNKCMMDLHDLKQSQGKETSKEQNGKFVTHKKGDQFKLFSSLQTPQQITSLHPSPFSFIPEQFNSNTHIIARLFKSPQKNCQHVLIYFHSNAEDILTSWKLTSHMRNSLSVHVLAVEYPGYSYYIGETSAKQIEQDSIRVFDYLVKDLQVQSQNILIVGRSMGTGAATYLASKRKVGVVALISPFTSLQSLLKDKVGFLGCLIANRFDNLQRIGQVTSPILIVHGKKDTLIPISHSKQLHSKCKAISELILPTEMTHNQFDFTGDFTVPLIAFMHKYNIKYNEIDFSKQIQFPPCLETMRNEHSAIQLESIQFTQNC